MEDESIAFSPETPQTELQIEQRFLVQIPRRGKTPAKNLGCFCDEGVAKVYATYETKGRAQVIPVLVLVDCDANKALILNPSEAFPCLDIEVPMLKALMSKVFDKKLDLDEQELIRTVYDDV